MTQLDFDEIVLGVRESVVVALELDVAPQELAIEAPLFGDRTQGGLGLDSLAALEVMYRVGDRFELPDLFEAGNDRIGSIGAIASLVVQHLAGDPVVAVDATVRPGLPQNVDTAQAVQA